MSKSVHICPLCKVTSLVVHCEDGRCGWFICRNKVCDAVLEPHRRRGHVLDPDPKKPRVRVVLAGNTWQVAS